MCNTRACKVVDLCTIINLIREIMDTTPQKNAQAFKITGDWTAQSKLLKEKFPQLTDADLKLETDKDAELLARVSTRLNKKDEEVINIINKGLAAKN